MSLVSALTESDYRALFAFRMALTRFQHWHAQQVSRAGLTSQQYNLLLAIRAHPKPGGPSIRELSDYLMLRHHSAVELVDRAVGTGMVRRVTDRRDRRVVRVRLSSAGETLVRDLENLHREELRQIAPALSMIYESLSKAPPDEA